MTYTADPTNANLPLDTDDASYAAAELRAIKARFTTLISGTFFTAGGTADAITGSLPLLSTGTCVSCIPPGANTLVAPTLNAVPIMKYNPAGVLVALAAGDYNSTTAFVFVYNATGGAGGTPVWALNLNATSAAASSNSVGATIYLATKCGAV